MSTKLEADPDKPRLKMKTKEKMKMKRTLKLVVTMVALLMILVGMFPNVALAASNPGVTLNTSKNVVTTTNAVLYATIVNPQAKKITDVGIKIVEKNTGAVLKSHTEKCVSSAAKLKSVSMWFDLNKELGVTLKPLTNYSYTMFAVIDGRKYTTDGSFLTLKKVSPIAPVKNARTTSPFGWRPLNGKQDYHYGIDLIGDKTIMAIANGTVVAVGNEKTGGNFVAVLHDDGYASCYFHLASYSVSKGAKVTQGQKVGVMGATGTGAQGVHLHMEIRTRWQGSLYGNGSWRADCVDPTTYISGLGK